MPPDVAVPDWFKSAYRVRQLTAVAFFLVAFVFVAVGIAFALQPNWLAVVVAASAGIAAVAMAKGYVLNIHHVVRADNNELEFTKGKGIRRINMSSIRGYFTFPLGYEVHFNIAVVMKNWKVVIVPNHPSHDLIGVLERNGKRRIQGM